jgi:hypothetical protein
MPKKQYVVQCSQTRKGEFEFNCETQDHICTTLKQARDIVKSRNDPEEFDDAGYFEYIIYEITLTKVKA